MSNLPDGLIGELLPQFDFEEYHRLGGIRSKPDQLLRAVNDFDDQADPWIGAAIRFREFPGRLLSRLGGSSGVAATRPRFGLADFTLLATRDQEIAYGLVGRFWRLNFGLQPCSGLSAFHQTRGNGLCRLVLYFRIVEEPGGTLMLETITRIACDDLYAKLMLAPYWVAIRPVSGWIRRRILRQLKQSAESCLPDTA